MELMVVVLLISILAILAIPSFTTTNYDRIAFNDTGYLTNVFRAARTRALARGAATVIHFSSSQGASQRGRFEIWEAVTADVPTGGTASTDFRTPVGSCKSPTTWVLPSITVPANTPTNTHANAFIDALDMNGAIEAQAQVFTKVLDPNGNAVTDAFLCFTPLGRIYYSTTATFDSATPMNGVLQIKVYVFDAAQTSQTRGIVRTVVVPSSGMARFIST